ncbi:peptide-methionine (S)-S-oxide reductase MsrA (plasmid) [Klebsiella pneumoniae]|uniref:peptide-methionine (S)-S-oxide reductase MsrA n=5 Tax=Enterobacterales TaxID=91347 RepID=UPI003BF7D3B2
MKTDVAILAGGCFWGVQELIRKLNGVVSTEVGYTGGRNDNPTYQHHPGHAEAVKVVYSPDKLSYRKLLEYFFSIHNPTTILRQGNDVGSSYRSAIFFTTEEQKQQANQLIREIDDSGVWPGVVVTEVEQAGEFWSAEPEHQDGTVAKLAMRQPFVLFKGLTFQKLCLPGAFRPGDHHNKMLRPGLCVVHASPQYL